MITIPIIGLTIPIWVAVVGVIVLLIILWQTDILQTLAFLLALVILLHFLGVIHIF